MSTRARTFSYDVSVDREWVAHSPRGETALPNEEGAWTPEHLVLAALCRCILTSFRYHARRAGFEPSSQAAAHGVITRRDEDGRFAFVEIEADVDVTFEPAPTLEALRELVVKGERDCFIAASLTTKPGYRWTVNGEDIP